MKEYYLIEIKTPLKKDSSFGGGSSGNEWWNNIWQPPNRNWILVGCAAGALGMLSLYNSSSREITWQEFRVKYLEQGEVNIFLCACIVFKYVCRLSVLN